MPGGVAHDFRPPTTGSFCCVVSASRWRCRGSLSCLFCLGRYLAPDSMPSDMLARHACSYFSTASVCRAIDRSFLASITVVLRTLLCFLSTTLGLAKCQITHIVRTVSSTIQRRHCLHTGMEQTAADHSLHSPACTRPTIPTEWTAFRSSALPSTGAAWSDHNTPAELSLLPEASKTSPKLEQIIRWSLQRPGSAHALPCSNPIDAKDEQSEPILALSLPPIFDNRGETSSIISDTRSKSSSIGRAVPKLRGSKRDLLVTAVSKITTFKEKHGRDPGISKTLQKADPAIEKARTGECTSCFDELPLTSLVNLPCTHDYCKPCLSTLILTALQNESAFPPKCCLSEIPAKTIIVALDRKQQQLYKEKAAEYSIPANRRW